jgi:hypothetical protein
MDRPCARLTLVSNGGVKMGSGRGVKITDTPSDLVLPRLDSNQQPFG